MLAALSFPNISPEIFAIEVFGFNLALRWYALSYIVGIALEGAAPLELALAKRRGRTISRANQAFLDWAAFKLL